MASYVAVVRWQCQAEPPVTSKQGLSLPPPPHGTIGTPPLPYRRPSCRYSLLSRHLFVTTIAVPRPRCRRRCLHPSLSLLPLCRYHPHAHTHIITIWQIQSGSTADTARYNSDDAGSPSTNSSTHPPIHRPTRLPAARPPTVCMTARPPARPPACLPACLLACPPAHRPTCPPAHIPICPHPRPPAYPSTHGPMQPTQREHSFSSLRGGGDPSFLTRRSSMPLCEPTASGG